MDDTPRERECDINDNSVILSSLIKIVRTRAVGDAGHGSDDFTNHNVDLFTVDRKKNDRETIVVQYNLRNNLESVIYILCISAPYHTTRH